MYALSHMLFILNCLYYNDYSKNKQRFNLEDKSFFTEFFEEKIIKSLKSLRRLQTFTSLWRG